MGCESGMRKILITNDDGIQSDGIKRLAAAAKKFGDVWVVAPDGQRSAMSHCINLREPIDAYPYDFPVEGVKAVATTGTPADCVRLGVCNIVPGRPDVVFSGINFGYNSGHDMQYSATVGAALEAASEGIHAIAFSEGFSDCHEVTDEYLEKVMADLLERDLKKNQIWNVNFPCCKLEECKGILENRTVSEKGFYDDHFKEEPLPDGGIRYTVDGIYGEDAEEGTDFRAIVDKYVSIGLVNNLK